MHRTGKKAGDISSKTTAEPNRKVASKSLRVLERVPDGSTAAHRRPS